MKVNNISEMAKALHVPAEDDKSLVLIQSKYSLIVVPTETGILIEETDNVKETLDLLDKGGYDVSKAQVFTCSN